MNRNKVLFFGMVLGIVFVMMAFFGFAFLNSDTAEISRTAEIGKAQYLYTQNVIGDIYIRAIFDNGIEPWWK